MAFLPSLSICLLCNGNWYKVDDIHFSPITELCSSSEQNYTLPELISLFLKFTDDYFEKKGSLNQEYANRQPKIKAETIYEKNGKKEIKKKKQCFSDVKDCPMNQNITQKLTNLEVKKTSTKIICY